MKILAIDPGSTESAWVVYDPQTKLPDSWAKEDNTEVLSRLMDVGLGFQCWPHVCVVEMVASYGMPVGAEVFDTCVWIGRFIEAVRVRVVETDSMFRRDVKLHLCGQARAKDTNIVHALYDLYGGSRSAAVGVKANPGPLYGFKADCWQALALAITYAETNL